MEFKKLSQLVLIGLTVNACTSAPPPPPPGLNYLAAAPLRLNVGAIEVVHEYVSPQKSPHVEHQLAITPANAVEQWAKDHLVAAGGIGRAVITIENASITETKLPKTGGVRGVFTYDQAERYDAHVVVKLEILDAKGFPKSFIKASAKRSRSVPENITIYHRKAELTRLLEDTLNALDAELTKNAQQYLAQ